MPDSASDGIVDAAARAHPLCPADQVPPGTAKRVVVAGHALAVFNVDGAFYVTDDTCSHGFASLADGFIDGALVECPWHGGAFDIRTGAAVGAPCVTPVAVHAPSIRDGLVWVELAQGGGQSDPETKRE